MQSRPIHLSGLLLWQNISYNNGGFWLRARALRATVFLGLLTSKMGAAPPPPHRPPRPTPIEIHAESGIEEKSANQ
jgi:hypothetical protein